MGATEGLAAPQVGVRGRVLIRPLQPDDLPTAAALVAREFTGRRAVEFLTAGLYEQPWADPDLPSLVATTEDDAIVGFIASHAHRLRHGDRVLRAACCSHLVVDPAHRTSAAGALLLRRFMAGPQDLSFSDTTTAVVARMWRASGGFVDPIRSVAWMRVMRPAAWAARVLAGRLGSEHLDEGLVPVRPVPLDRGRVAVPPPPGLDEEELTAERAAAHVDEILAGVPLRAPYDEPWLRWVIARLDEHYGPGRVVRRLVLRRGRPLGWYVYVRGAQGAATVLQVAATGRNVDPVVGAMFESARSDRTIALTGRVEPHLVEALRAQKCAMGAGQRAINATSDTAVLAALATPGALLSRLDGEWW